MTITCEEHKLLYTPDPLRCLPDWTGIPKDYTVPLGPFPDLAHTGLTEPLPLIIAGGVLLAVGVYYLIRDRWHTRG